MRAVAILGYAPTTRDLINTVAPWVEIQGLNRTHDILRQKPARWFQLHPPGWRGDRTLTYCRGQDHLDYLKALECPVYQLQLDPRIPGSTLYPREAVVKMLGRDYLTSSFAYAIALAIYEQVDEIQLYGCDLISTTEFIHQRPCVEWLCGLAEARGIKITLPLAGLLLEGAGYPAQEDERIQAQERVLFWKSDYMIHWQAWAFAMGVLQEAQRHEDRSRIEQVEPAIGAIVSKMHAAGGGLKESIHRLAMLGIADTMAAQLPRIQLPPNMIDEPPLVEALASEVPA